MKVGEFRCLTSKPGAKWPRYEARISAGLSLGDAKRETQLLLRSNDVKVSVLSQFSYDVASGMVDTRINRE